MTPFSTYKTKQSVAGTVQLEFEKPFCRKKEGSSQRIMGDIEVGQINQPEGLPTKILEILS